MSDEKLFCGNCGAKIKSGSVFANNEIQSDEVISLSNKIFDKKNETYCQLCRPKISEILKANSWLNNYINSNIYIIPIVTTHTPLNWDYSALGIVTGQSVIGTGLISEFKSSFTDLFGMNSSSFSSKIADGERNCMLQLRMKTLNLGGNAIIATDIDYGELGSVKGMIMVCAAGTAIKLRNTEVVQYDAEKYNELIKHSDTLKAVIRLQSIITE